MAGLYTEAQKLGIKVGTDWLSGQIEINGKLVTYAQLLQAVTDAENLNLAENEQRDRFTITKVIPDLQAVQDVLTAQEQQLQNQTGWEVMQTSAIDMTVKKPRTNWA